MKVLTVHPSFSDINARGSEIIAQQTYLLLKEHGVDSYFFANSGQHYLENENFTKYFPDTSKKFSLEWWWNTKAEKQMEKMIADIKPNIVHIHMTNNLTYSIFRPIIEKNIPIVMTVHDPGLICPVRQAWNTETCSICKKCKGINTIPCIINNCSQTHRISSSVYYAVRSVLEFLSGYNKKIDKFIVPSNALGELIKSTDITQNKIITVPNFIDDIFMKQEISNKQDFFLYAGTLSDYKGVDVLLKAVEIVDKNIPFKIVGNGTDENKYKDIVINKGFTNVEFINGVDRGDMIHFYKDCISVIVPSNYFEIFGMINIEAFSLGKPSIASEIGGMPEIVHNNSNGLLFEPGNYNELAECITKLWNNKELAKNMGQNARQDVSKYYTKESYINNLINIYTSLL